MSKAAVQLAEDPRDTPIYSVQEAAAYVGVPRSTLRHWLKATEKHRAVIEADGYPPMLSFYNLLEAHVLRVALQRDAWLSRVRAGVETLRAELPNAKHPLIENKIFTVRGLRSIFTTSITGELQNLSKGGELAFHSLLQKHLERIELDSFGRPFQLFPFGYRHIAINHRVSGGRPVVRNTGILVDVIAQRKRAGESLDEIAHDYSISRADVREAIKYATAA